MRTLPVFLLHPFRVLSLLLLYSLPAGAQTLYVTNTTNFSTSQSYSNGFIGSSNILTSFSGNLMIDSGAVLTVSNTLSVGRVTTNNAVTVSGAGSELSVAELVLGFQNSGNSLLVTNGATLRTDLTNASSESVNTGSFGAASNNILTVTGVGSSWIQTNTNRAVTIGNSGDNNQLIFSGGSVSSIGSVINIGGQNVSANSNSLLVTGSGTILTNRSIILGGGDGQSLVISDGAQVFSTATGSATINPSFSLAASSGALTAGQRHTALITDPGTVYTMSGGANVGLFGPASLVVSNGASVLLTGSSDPVIVGSGASANGSSLLVTGSGTTWTNNANQWTIGNGANTNSSMVVNAGAIVSGGNGVEIGAASNSTAASLTIDAATFNLTNGPMRAGYLGSQSRLVVTNQGVLNLNASFIAGQGSSDVNGAHSNITLVTGAGSTVVQASSFAGGNAIGLFGRGNSLVVSNGATVVMGGPTTGFNQNQLGSFTNSSDNSLVVTDAGSVWGGRGDLDVGIRGSSNYASVLNGGLITNGTVRLGLSNSATGNYLLVDGAGSVFSNRISVTVGNGTNTGNRINVTNDGVLHTGGLLNVQSNSTVNAAGSVWVGQGRPSVQTVNVLHTNANSNSVMTVNGLVAAEGTVTVGTRGVLGGAGTVRATETIIASGGTLSPGNSPGTLTVDGDLTWLGGGNYNWQIHNATGLVGTGWDYMLVTGALDLTALTPGSKFNINLWSLSAVSPDANGAAINFDNTLAGQSWDILVAVGGITGFDAADFNINIGATNGAGGFANALAPGGFFGIQQQGNVISLTYTVPEPSTYALLALAAGAAGYMRWRKR